MGSRLRLDPSNIFECYCEVVGPNGENEGPWIIQKFPSTFEDNEVLKSVPQFTYPCKFEKSAVEHFSFVLTNFESKFLYGFCRHSPDSETAILILSHMPWHELFYKILNHCASLLCKENNGDLWTFLQSLYKSAIPAAGTNLQLSYADGKNFSTECPNHSSLPTISQNRNLSEYYSAVDVSNMLIIFASMLNERRIIVVSDRISRASSCVQAANALIYPMTWQHIFIPVLPEHLVDYAYAPMPFLIGLPSPLLKKIRLEEAGEVVILNADKNEVSTPFSDVESLPIEVISTLKRNLSQQNYLLGDAVARAFMKALIQLMGNYREALQLRDGDRRITFNAEKFVSLRPPHYQIFINKMLQLQIFRQFIEERLDLLNSGLHTTDQFEVELSLYEDKSSSKVKQLISNVKKESGAMLKNVRSKTNPAMKSAVKGFTKGGKNVREKSKSTYKEIRGKFKDNIQQINNKRNSTNSDRKPSSAPSSPTRTFRQNLSSNFDDARSKSSRQNFPATFDDVITAKKTYKRMASEVSEFSIEENNNKEKGFSSSSSEGSKTPSPQAIDLMGEVREVLRWPGEKNSTEEESFSNQSNHLLDFSNQSNKLIDTSSIDTSSQPNKLIHTYSSQSNKLIHTYSSQSNNLIHTSSSPSNKLIDTSSSQSNKLIHTSSSQSNKLIDTSSSPSNKLIDTSSSESSQSNKSQSNKLIDYSSDQSIGSSFLNQFRNKDLLSQFKNDFSYHSNHLIGDQLFVQNRVKNDTFSNQLIPNKLSKPKYGKLSDDLVENESDYVINTSNHPMSKFSNHSEEVIGNKVTDQNNQFMRPNQFLDDFSNHSEKLIENFSNQSIGESLPSDFSANHMMAASRDSKSLSSVRENEHSFKLSSNSTSNSHSIQNANIQNVTLNGSNIQIANNPNIQYFTSNGPILQNFTSSDHIIQNSTSNNSSTSNAKNFTSNGSTFQNSTFNGSDISHLNPKSSYRSFKISNNSCSNFNNFPSSVSVTSSNSSQFAGIDSIKSRENSKDTWINFTNDTGVDSVSSKCNNVLNSNLDSEVVSRENLAQCIATVATPPSNHSPHLKNSKDSKCIFPKYEASLSFSQSLARFHNRDSKFNRSFCCSANSFSRSFDRKIEPNSFDLYCRPSYIGQKNGPNSLDLKNVSSSFGMINEPSLKSKPNSLQKSKSSKDCYFSLQRNCTSSISKEVAHARPLKSQISELKTNNTNTDLKAQSLSPSKDFLRNKSYVRPVSPKTQNKSKLYSETKKKRNIKPSLENFSNGICSEIGNEIRSKKFNVDRTQLKISSSDNICPKLSTVQANKSKPLLKTSKKEESFGKTILFRDSIITSSITCQNKSVNRNKVVQLIGKNVPKTHLSENKHRSIPTADLISSKRYKIFKSVENLPNNTPVNSFMDTSEALASDSSTLSCVSGDSSKNSNVSIDASKSSNVIQCIFDRTKIFDVLNCQDSLASNKLEVLKGSKKIESPNCYQNLENLNNSSKNFVSNFDSTNPDFMLLNGGLDVPGSVLIRPPPNFNRRRKINVTPKNLFLNSPLKEESVAQKNTLGFDCTSEIKKLESSGDKDRDSLEGDSSSLRRKLNPDRYRPFTSLEDLAPHKNPFSGSESFSKGGKASERSSVESFTEYPVNAVSSQPVGCSRGLTEVLSEPIAPSVSVEPIVPPRNIVKGVLSQPVAPSMIYAPKLPPKSQNFSFSSNADFKKVFDKKKNFEQIQNFRPNSGISLNKPNSIENPLYSAHQTFLNSKSCESAAKKFQDVTTNITTNRISNVQKSLSWGQNVDIAHETSNTCLNVFEMGKKSSNIGHETSNPCLNVFEIGKKSSNIGHETSNTSLNAFEIDKKSSNIGQEVEEIDENVPELSKKCENSRNSRKIGNKSKADQNSILDLDIPDVHNVPILHMKQNSEYNNNKSSILTTNFPAHFEFNETKNLPKLSASLTNDTAGFYSNFENKQNIDPAISQNRNKISATVSSDSENKCATKCSANFDNHATNFSATFDDHATNFPANFDDHATNFPANFDDHATNFSANFDDHATNFSANFDEHFKPNKKVSVISKSDKDLLGDFTSEFKKLSVNSSKSNK